MLQQQKQAVSQFRQRDKTEPFRVRSKKNVI